MKKETKSLKDRGGKLRQEKIYRSPKIFPVGKAKDLVQGYNYGKYNDGYAGYYWER